MRKEVRVGVNRIGESIDMVCGWGVDMKRKEEEDEDDYEMVMDMGKGK